MAQCPRGHLVGAVEPGIVGRVHHLAADIVERQWIARGAAQQPAVCLRLPLRLRLRHPARGNQITQRIVERQGAGGFAADLYGARIEIDLIPGEGDDLLSTQAAEQARQEQMPVIIRRPHQCGDLGIGQFPRLGVGWRQTGVFRGEQGT